MELIGLVKSTHCLGMKTLDAETLANVGVVLKTENSFGYEINQAKLAEQ